MKKSQLLAEKSHFKLLSRKISEWISNSDTLLLPGLLVSCLQNISMLLFFILSRSMELEHVMSVGVFGILLLVQLQGHFACGSVLQSTVCGADHIAYSISNDHSLFYINGDLVNKGALCKVVQAYKANQCILGSDFTRNLCGLDLLLADVPSKSARKILQVRKERFLSSDQTSPNDEKNGSDSFPTSTKIGVAATGLFAMCCVVFCPCLYKRRKDTDHTVLDKELNSIDLASSIELSVGSQKVPGSPLRAPGSPFRAPGSPFWAPGSPFRAPGSPFHAPASPFRIPPSPSRFSMSPKLTRHGSVHLTIQQAAKATHNFSPSLRIGEGGFGTVYKARLEDGQVVAIKRGKKEQFENLQTEFSSEVDLLAKIDHRNLVKLLGYVDKGDERLLVTEYVPYGTLRDHLDGERGKILDFNQRLEIAIDVAHGLTYLHTYAEKQIIHRDVKSSNILLTENLRAKVADFGFARLGLVDNDHTHISTKVKGTVGYLDPEYMKTYQLTPKSDVYSFGILLIEILTGRRPVELKRPIEERVTLRWVFKKFNEGIVAELVDPAMEETVDREILFNMLRLAIQCAAPIRADRPDMKSVVKQLWFIRAEYGKKRESNKSS